MAVVHHVQLCVANGVETVCKLRKYGFRLHARRELPGYCKQYVCKLGSIYFIVTERDKGLKTIPETRSWVRQDPFLVLCCEDRPSHEIDTVFNVALSVKDVNQLTNRIEKTYGGTVVETPRTVEDECGRIAYSIIKSPCGNVVHTLLNTSEYTGVFLPGFELTRGVDEDIEHCSAELAENISHIDHVTLATNSGDSMRIIEFYQACFGMKKFNISSNDDVDEGLILDDGVGLRLRAMEYYKCAETGLLYDPSLGECDVESSSRASGDKTVLFVVVESLPGQMNCNVEAYLKEHKQPGVEHIAFRTSNIYESVRAMKSLSINFRKPPEAYYEHVLDALQLKKEKNLADIGENFEQLAKLGILLDNEVEPDTTPKGTVNYLMQIFAHPLFDPSKTFFIEIIQRYGAKGLGAGNIIALVKSIREEEKRKAREKNEKKRSDDPIKCPRSVC